MELTFTRKAALAMIFCFAQVSVGWGQKQAQTAFLPESVQLSTSIGPGANSRVLHSGPADPEGLNVIRQGPASLPVFIKGKLARKGQAAARKATTPREAGFSYLRELKATLQIVEPDQEFAVDRVETDALQQTHIKMRQQYRGVPVYGGELYLHAQQNEVSVLNGQYFPTPSLVSVIPTVSEQNAIKTALAAVGKTSSRSHKSLLSTILGQRETTAELVIYHPNRNPAAERLTWHVTVQPGLVHRWEYFIDAQSGAVLHKYNHLCSLDGPQTASAKDLNNVTQSLNTYQKGETYYLLDAARAMYDNRSTLPESGMGVIYTLDLKDASYANEEAEMFFVTSTDNTWTSPASVSAHYNAGMAYEYFRTKHGRNAIDGRGGSIISIINAKDEEDELWDNAVWNGQYIIYGNGKDAFKPLAGALDVAGHELTHGVVQYTANLEYQGQSGAINESMADVFGALIEGRNWTIGEDIVKPTSYPSGALRSLQDPHNGGTSLADFNEGYQPAHVSEMYTGNEDDGGVHVNSGIPNKAFYLFATAPGMTKDKAGRVYYRALTLYLTRLSQFTDLRYAVVQAATDLYGATSGEVTAAKNAFTSVGIVEPASGPTEAGYASTLPVNPGGDFVLYYSTSDNTLRNANMATQTATILTNTPLKGKPSVTDNGTEAYFVAQSGIIRAVTLKGAVNERTIDNQTIWDNVAVSKDGTKLAAVKVAKEPIIHVYDIPRGQWTAVELNNTVPVHEGEKMVDIHSLEWDYTGEKILFDALYSYVEETQDKEYWDIGLANLWSRAGNKAGDGKIQKFLQFNSDVINPAFAKNSPHIVAFDYVDKSSAQTIYYLVTMNLKTYVYRDIFGSTVMNEPSFDRTDSRVVFGARAVDGTTLVTGALPLAEDKLLTTGNATGLIGNSKWAVWYAQGNRNLLASEEDMADRVNASVFPNPFATELSCSFEYKGKGAVMIQLFNALGQETKRFQISHPQKGTNVKTLSIQDLPSGPYVLRLTNGPETSSYRLIKQ
ncbi:M4 family metallopeptidase [Rufibacter psychrotolerans]|uniref:M4 family metallopeptidase n=1 Tax=Rufibacter psychrotolerans TaxID=2812556 RepID=UPI0019685093|nr:M4 family metallopeptidase [Rufibacter sp. SYSU D00308]